MKNSIKLAATVAVVASLSGILCPPAGAFDFQSILQNLSHGVSGWPELDNRENEISTQLNAAASSGQLSTAEADGFKGELARVQQVEFQIKASGRSLSATDAISFTNSLNNLTNRINLAISGKTTTNATNLALVDSERAQLNQRVADARTAHTITRTDADLIKRDLDHNANIQSAFTTSGDGAVTARQAQVLSDDLARIKIALDQHLTIGQAGVPQLSNQRNAIEQMIATGRSSGTINDYQATDFHRELSRIANMQTNFLAADGALSGNEIIAVAGELDRLRSRVEYQNSIAASGGPWNTGGYGGNENGGAVHVGNDNGGYGHGGNNWHGNETGSGGNNWHGSQTGGNNWHGNDTGYGGNNGRGNETGYGSNNGRGNETGYGGNNWHGSQTGGNNWHGNETGYGERNANQGQGQPHTLQEIADRQARLQNLINTNSRRLSRADTFRFRNAFDRIAQSAEQLRATGGGSLTFDQNQKLWADLTQLDSQVSAQISATPRHRQGYGRQY